ncbi:hypothetical protein MKX07_003257 [Trichoderma sp. CBMAI-0711]|uniref:Uncharacterized protein n=1 Tax=Trichoderma parareesei TaxID=858221 RepID=A0A2H2ZUX3_TRIPA|nr:hypothetical protein MKX07_003257 [Trichoderma sp. CBMAI-0711]OTA05806.1 hypothetical protein A9Z42_0065180 [Trichoderma parareesei]
MTFPSHFHMSGTFHDGVHPGLFRPPASPSSSTDYLPSSTLAAESSKRKWSRSSVPRVQTGSFFHDVYMESGPAAAGAAAARSRTYALAGQLHTPVIGGYSEDVDGDGDGDADTAMGESMYSDSDYRRALGTKRSREDLDDSSGGPTPLFSQPEPSQSSQSGIWGTFSLSTIGDVVGRVWEFCKAGAFKGFYAGGGASYKVTTAGVSVDETGSSRDQTFYFQGSDQQEQQHCYLNQQQPLQQPRRHHHHHQQRRGDRSRYAQDQLPRRNHYSSSSNYDSSFDSRTSTPTGPASKKRRRTESGSELGQSWVMIQEPSREPEMTTPRKMSTSSRVSPRHRAQQTPLADHRMGPPSSFATPPTTSSPAPLRPASRAASRPGSRLADAASLFRTQQPASAASFASFKAPAAVSAPPKPSPAKSRIPVKANSSAVVASSAALSTFDQGKRRRHTIAPSVAEPSPLSGRRRRDSVASVATSRATEIDASPRLDAEARQLAARRQMEEDDTDKRMAAFNKQLQDMIRQGRAALGTTVEVDAGWEDAL